MHQQLSDSASQGMYLLILVMGHGIGDMVLMGKADVLVDICGVGVLLDYRGLALFLLTFLIK
ncbi:hypothetical protein J3F84DRAFT_358480 [Trichoderma pleuroticola]